MCLQFITPSQLTLSVLPALYGFRRPNSILIDCETIHISKLLCCREPLIVREKIYSEAKKANINNQAHLLNCSNWSILYDVFFLYCLVLCEHSLRK